MVHERYTVGSLTTGTWNNKGKFNVLSYGPLLGTPLTLITLQRNIEFSFNVPLNIVQFQEKREQYKLFNQTKKLMYITTLSTMIHAKKIFGQFQPNNMAIKDFSITPFS